MLKTSLYWPVSDFFSSWWLYECDFPQRWPSGLTSPSTAFTAALRPGLYLPPFFLALFLGLTSLFPSPCLFSFSLHLFKVVWQAARMKEKWNGRRKGVELSRELNFIHISPDPIVHPKLVNTIILLWVWDWFYPSDRSLGTWAKLWQQGESISVWCNKLGYKAIKLPKKKPCIAFSSTYRLQPHDVSPMRCFKMETSQWTTLSLLHKDS